MWLYQQDFEFLPIPVPLFQHDGIHSSQIFRRVQTRGRPQILGRSGANPRVVLLRIIRSHDDENVPGMTFAGVNDGPKLYNYFKVCPGLLLGALFD